MSFIEVFPEELVEATKVDEVVLWLKLLPVPMKIKKTMIVDWTKQTGVKLTQELVSSIGIPKEF